MARAASRLTTVDEFLAFEGEPDTRYQLIRGQITAMAPARAIHGELVMRLGARILSALPPACRVVSEAGIRPGHRDDTYWLADLAVACSPRQPGEIYLADPCLIVEVLSPSTEATDKLLKLADYRAMRSVQDILLVASTHRHVEHWQRRGDLWTVRDLGSGTSVAIESLAITIAVDELYADMLLEEGEGGSAA